MEKKTAIGATIKISGKCEIVDAATLLLEEYCTVLHKSRIVPHRDDAAFGIGVARLGVPGRAKTDLLDAIL